MNTRSTMERITPYLQFLGMLMVIPLAGCMILPVPSSAKKIEASRSIHAEDLRFVQPGVTRREQLESKLGKPWTNYTDLRVSVYYWEAVTGHWVWGIAGPAPGPGMVVMGDTCPITRMEILCVAFNGDDIVTRFQIMRHPGNKTTKQTVMAWQRGN